MDKCLYKSDGKCCCSLSSYHCKPVTEPICSICDWYVDKVVLTEKQVKDKFIQDAIDSIKTEDYKNVVIALSKAQNY